MLSALSGQFGLYRSVALVRPQRRGRAGQRRYRQISSRIPFLGPSSLNSTMRWLSTMRKRSRGRSVEPGTRPLPSVDVPSAGFCRDGLTSTMAESGQQHQKGTKSMRYADLYTKVILTIIAVLLVWNVVGRLRVSAVHAQSTSSRYFVEQISADRMSKEYQNRPCNRDKRCGQRAAINHCDPVRSAGKVPCCVQVARALKYDPGLVVPEIPSWV